MERFKFGLRPLTQRVRLSETWEVVGFDTETLPFNYYLLRPGDHPDKEHKDIYSVQISRSGGVAQFIHASGHDFKPGVAKLAELFPRRALIFAHNLGFDLSVLLGPDYLEFVNGYKEVARDGWVVKGNIVDGQMCFARFRFFDVGDDGYKLAKDLRFIDTMNFYGRRKLENVAKDELPDRSDLRKLDKPEYLGKRMPEKGELDYFVEYAVQDARLAEMLGQKEYNKQAGLGVRFSNTPAALSRALFRLRYQKKPIRLLPLDQLGFVWKTYYGGRFEAYTRGHPDMRVKVLDFNSLYPTAATFPLPLELFELDGYPFGDFEDDEDLVGFVRCSFKFPEGTPYPCLPVRTSKLFFPLQGATYCTSYEARLALSLGAELTEFSFLGFQPRVRERNNPIRKFMLDTYKEKEQLDKELSEYKARGEPFPEGLKQRRQLVKSVLTNFYGKFAEQHQDPIIKTTWHAGPMFDPPIASLITGKARELLARALIKYESHYTDTDSLVTSKKLDKKDGGVKLGKLKVELDDANIWMVRPKLYYAVDDEGNEKMAIHSFRRREVFKELLLHGDPSLKVGEYRHERMLKPKEAFRRKLLPRAFITQKFRISLGPDNKRLYERPLNTLGEIRYESSGSEALHYAPN